MLTVEVMTFFDISPHFFAVKVSSLWFLVLAVRVGGFGACG